MPRSNRPRSRWGLKSGHFSHPFRWKVDQDYAHKLPPEIKDWLAKFNSEYYGGRFPADSIHPNTGEVKREVWRQREATKRDVLSRAYDQDRLNENQESQLLYAGREAVGPEERGSSIAKYVRAAEVHRHSIVAPTASGRSLSRTASSARRKS